MLPFVDDTTVAVWRGSGPYCAIPPYHPARAWPEYPFPAGDLPPANAAYEGVREALRLLALDATHFGASAWNPLGELIQPGMTVLLKPNLIRESHALRPQEWEQVVTHGSVIRAVLDYVHIALRGRGRVIIADGPQTDSDFAALARKNGLDEVVAWCRAHGLDASLLDLRRDRWYEKGDIIYRRETLPGDPAGYTTVELGSGSAFASYRLNGRFYGADYDADETASYHRDGRHAYVICRSVMDADVVINLPKLKTHKKTGVTISLKNLVGINGYRNCLPHHSFGSPDQGGDEFPAGSAKRTLESRGIRTFKRLLRSLGGRGGSWARLVKRAGRAVFGDTRQVVRSGNWYGNDTTWRMALDLNKALFYFDGEGRPRAAPPRGLSIVDGLVAGEGDGPSAPDAVNAGLIVAGGNPVVVDSACVALMGYDRSRIPLVDRAWRERPHPLVAFGPEAVRCVSNEPGWNGGLADLERAPAHIFAPHFGWRGHIERTAPREDQVTTR
jgi:uncharacterized protein (DUF362 family)